jgi:hypothetical protein
MSFKLLLLTQNLKLKTHHYAKMCVAQLNLTFLVF